MLSNARRDTATIKKLIESLLEQRSSAPISTKSEEVGGALISDAAASVEMKDAPALSMGKIVPINPEVAPPEVETPMDSTSSTIDGSAPETAEEMEEDPKPRPLRRFDTDEPETATQDGQALALAAERGDLEMTELLLDFDVNPNTIGSFHGSPLQAAAFCGRVEVAKLLVARGADCDRPGHRWGSPLCAAVKGGHPEIVKILLSAGADPNGGVVLEQAAGAGDTRSVKLLLNHGASADVRGGFHGSPLQAAAFCGHLEVVKVLLAAGADAGASGHRWGGPLQAAVQGGYKDIARELLEHKRKPKS